MPPQKHLCKQSVACCQGLMRTPIFKLILYDEKQHVPMLKTIALKMMSHPFVQTNVLPTYWKKKEGGLGETLYLSLHSHPLVDCTVVVFCSMLQRHFHLFGDN